MNDDESYGRLMSVGTLRNLREPSLFKVLKYVMARNTFLGLILTKCLNWDSHYVGQIMGYLFKRTKVSGVFMDKR
jgi:hypothetical protein